MVSRGPDPPDRRAARVRANGDKEWWTRGLCHRADGPAVMSADGSRQWFRHGLRHRLDGPAVMHPGGALEWWVDGWAAHTREWVAVILARFRSRELDHLRCDSTQPCDGAARPMPRGATPQAAD